MKVVVVASTKGGVGKSTLVVALAEAASSQGSRVGVMDLDPQGTVRDWIGLRGDKRDIVWVDTLNLREAVRHGELVGLDLLVIDTPPALISLIEAAVRQADLVVIPVRPSPVDVLGVQAMTALVREQGRPFVCVLSQTTPGGAYQSEAVSHLKKISSVLKQTVSAREAHALAFARGATAREEKTDKLAGREIETVWSEIENILKRQKRTAKTIN